MILDDRTVLVKVENPHSHQEGISISIAWGDEFPISQNHIIALYNVYFGLERDRYNKTSKIRDILLSLESVWTDEVVIGEKDHQLMNLFTQRNKMVLVSQRVDREVPLTSLERQLGAKTLSPIVAPKYLSYEGEGGLKLPTDISARVFEYLVDLRILKSSLFNENHFFFEEKTLSNYETIRWEGTDRIPTQQDLLFSEQYYSKVDKKCGKCDSDVSQTVEGIHKDLPKATTFVLCGPCQSKVNNFFLHFFRLILKNGGISSASPAT